MGHNQPAGSPRGEQAEHRLSGPQQERVAAALRSESTPETHNATVGVSGHAPGAKGSGQAAKAALIGGGSLVACALVAGGLWFASSDSSDDSPTQTEQAAQTEEATETTEETSEQTEAETDDGGETAADDNSSEPEGDTDSDNDDPASSLGAEDAPNTEADPVDSDDTDGAGDETDNSAPATDETAEPADESEQVDEGGTTRLANTDELLEENEAVYRDGKLFLSGPIQSQERIDYIVGLATPLLGEENVINEYYVDPTQTTQSNGAVRIDEPLLFASGSTELNPDLKGILDLGVTVMVVFPDVTMQVIGHTDDAGPEDGNQVLSEARAQAVVDYMVGKGIAADRFDAFGLGETQPVADNFTEEGRTKNRRIDVALLDLLADAPTN